MHILIVDDERQITRVLRASLQSCGYEVTVANNGLEALEKFRARPADLIVTDLAMPEMSGIELTRAVRAIADTPIIVLSVREQETMKVAALDEGADDYVTKPFSMPELLARVRSALRRGAQAEPIAEILTAGALTVNTAQHRVTRDGTEVHLTPKEFDLLRLLAATPGSVIPHKQLLRGIWGLNAESQPDYLRVLVAQLRRKLDTEGESSLIESEPWVGYRLRIAPVSTATTTTDLSS